jgi:hypothetical protein
LLSKVRFASKFGEIYSAEPLLERTRRSTEEKYAATAALTENAIKSPFCG